MTPISPLRQRQLLAFWAPLASTWLMMSIEGPFLAAVIARLPDAKVNLAAYGVAFAIALIVESPVIMMLSAATALATDRDAFARLRRFTYALNGAVTASMILVLLPPVFDVWATGWMNLPADVSRHVWVALAILLPWPGAIGYRRLYQGLMIRGGQTRRVAYGTLVRLLAMASTSLVLSLTTTTPGAWVGASALSAGVLAEAVASRVMAIGLARRLDARADGESRLSYAAVARFYVPLAMTSFIGLASQPVTTFFMAQARSSLESLAVVPVVLALTFIFRSMGLAYQDVAITFLGRDRANGGPVVRFAGWLGLAASLLFGAIAFTPLAGVWFGTISGLSPELTSFALLPARILVLMPAMSVLLSLERAILVSGRTTRPITAATALELAVLASVLLLGIHWLDLVGATAAAIALVAGRVASNTFLLPPCLSTLRRAGGERS